ncbi:MAG: hypothetical protein V4689_15820 [Verrucomicrobiota bacterium]
MTSGFSDPNNHIPEITPDDEWGDSDSHVTEINPSATALPPRRSVTDKASSAVETPETGLRIDSKVIREEVSETPRKLQVQEITGSVLRLEQDDSAPARVERVVAFREKPAHLKNGKNPRGEGLEWGRAHRSSPRWILGMALTILILVVLGIAMAPRINAPNAGRKITAAPMIEDEETSEGADQMNQMLERQSEAMQIFRSFSQAVHFDEIVPLVRDGASLKDTLRENWKPMGISNQWAPAEDCSWGVVELGGHPCGLLQGQLPDHSKFTAYFTRESNRLLLDWKATTAYGTATFDQLESGEADGSEIRGEISLTDFYTSSFPEAGYQSFRFISPDEKTTIWCYALRSSLTFGQIARHLQTGEIVQEAPGPKRITLRLDREPDGALPNQWLIGGMLHIDWASP